MTQQKFDLFGKPGKDSIRVGYIDPDKGYVASNSIYEANVYAQLNPGTTFILENRDGVRYLSINEVNKLDATKGWPKDKSLPNGPLPKDTTCEDGIKGLKPGETATYPGGGEPLTVGGDTNNKVTVGANGGNPVTSGGNGGTNIIVGGKVPTSASKKKLKVGGSGGTPVFLGGTGGQAVFVDNNVLSINGTPVLVGSTGGIPLKVGGSGGTPVTTNGTSQCQGKIHITGGSGVGAYAVPIFGTDGSLLAATVTDGGFGYKTPPHSKVVDTCGRGAGAVLKTYIGTTAKTTEYFDQEDDFEIVDLTPPSGDQVGYGFRFTPDGQTIEQWDPNLFASLQTSPIKLQIKEYQDFLTQTPISPFWHTRKEEPLEIIFRDQGQDVKNDVQHWRWGGKSIITTDPGKSQPPAKSDQFEELEFEVFTQGGNQVDRDLQFNFTSEDGKHKFQFKAPEFKDNRKTKVKRKVKRNTVYKVVASGRYKGKGVEQGLIAGIGRGAREIKGNKKGKVIFADFVRSANDNDDLQVRAKQGMFTATGERKTTDGHSTNNLTYKFESNKDFKPTEPKKPAKPQKKVTNVIEDSFMNRYAISPVPASNVPGSDFAGRWATFLWKEEFPHDGEYKFRGASDNRGRLYLDNELVIEQDKFEGEPTKVVSKNIKKGTHEIRVDLFNNPVKEKVVIKLPQAQAQPQLPGKVPVKFDVYGEGKRVSQIITYIFTSEDGKDSFTFKPKKTDAKRYSYSRTVNVLPNTNYNVQAVAGGSSDSTSQQSEYKISIANRGKLGRGINAAVRKVEKKTIKFTDSKSQNDTDAEFKILPGSPGVTAEFRGSDENDLKLVVKGSGDLTLQLEWDDDPNKNGKAVGSLKIAGETFKQTAHKDKKGDVKKTINVGGSRYNSTNRLEQGTLKRDTFKRSGKESSSKSNVIFADITSSTNDNDDMQIRCGTGEFTPSNKRKIDGHSTYDLKFRVDVDVPTGTIGGSKSVSNSNQSTIYGSIFNTADYINKADRKLWRTNVYGRGGFLNDNGICPFDTKNPLPDNPYAGTHVIIWQGIDFPVDGNYDITVDADDRVMMYIGNREGDGAAAIGNGLISVTQGGDEVIIENGMDKTTHTKFFKKGKYRIRAELTQAPGGVFTFDENGNAGGPDVTARFVERGGQNYLKVEGSGSAEIHFRLRFDDNPNQSGIVASKIRIGKGPNDFIELKRSSLFGSRLRTKETITGSAFFEAGREYLVKTVDAGRNTGSIIKNNGETIEYDDDIQNGFDFNAGLTITNITNQQKPKVKGVNPMALAVDIRPRDIEQTRISAKSWQENPMGAAFTIDAPLPPIPQEPKPQQVGRCPDNPLWTTRFPGASESWWPVNYTRKLDGKFIWSKFTNRFAMSPLPPRVEKNTDGSGQTFSTDWTVDFPYTGFYGFKGTCDDIGRILLDDVEVHKLQHMGEVKPDFTKKEVKQGKHKVTVEVTNQDFRKRKTITQEIFSTKRWKKPAKVDPPTPISKELLVEYRGLNRGSTTVVTIGGSGEKRYPIKVADRGKLGRGLNAAVRKVEKKTIKFTDSKSQNDTDAEFKILPGSPGVTAEFRGSNDDNLELVVKGSGDLTLQLEWDDDPKKNGEAVGNIKVAGETWKQRAFKDKKGDVKKTIKVGSTETKEVVGKGGYIVNKDRDEVRMKDGHGDDINSTFKIETSTVDAKFSSDGKKIEYKGSGTITLKLFWDDNPRTAGVAVDSIAVGGKVWDQKGGKGSRTQTIEVKGELLSTSGGVQSGKADRGVTYTGPDLFSFKYPRWSEFMNDASVSPYLPPLDSENPAFYTDTRHKWTNVDFPENGRYYVRFQADNIGKIFIGGKELPQLESRSFRGEALPNYIELSRGKYDIEVVLTNVPSNSKVFNENPSGFALQITRKDTIVSKDSKSWVENPIGASAIIIPPPCPKETEGTGIVTRIEVLQPGNSYPTTKKKTGGGGGIPATTLLVDVVPDKTGIGYTPGDRVIIETPNGPPIELTPIVNDFGQIVRIPVETGTPGGDPPPPSDPPPPGDPPDPPGQPPQKIPELPGGDDDGSGGPRGLGSFDIITNTDTQILQVTDLPGQIGVEDLTGVLVPLVKSGGLISPSTSPTVVPAPGPFYGFTEYPNIYVRSNTGLGFRGRPVFDIVVIPEKILPDEMVLQVVDIPGLRQIGYVNGKPYYGQVFALNGNLYAGVSQYVGELIPVYATLEASVLNQQTIQPSAILRSGSQTLDDNPLIQ